MTPPARHVYLVDDDEAVRSAMRLLLVTLDFTVTTYAEPMAFLADLAHLVPGCIVADIRMPVLSGLKMQERLAEARCDWPVIVISGHGDIEACRRAFRNGAIDFLRKPIDEQDLIDTIQKGHALLSLAASLAKERAEALALLARLTAREHEVLELVSRGFLTRQIAESLGLSQRTVESHRAHISAKLGTTSPAEMARMLIDSGKHR